MPRLILKTADRFEGDFALEFEAGKQVASEEAAYLSFIEPVLAELADLSIPDADEVVAAQLRMHRKDFAKRLHSLAEEIAASSDDAERVKKCRDYRDKAIRFHGIFLERCSQLNAIPFSVRADEDDKGRINDLLISTSDVYIPPDKQNFRVEVDRALGVIRAVLLERNTEDGKSRLNEYLRALKGVATVGLTGSDPTQVQLGRLALAGLKDEFVSREAGFVKNAYVLRLGVSALVAVVLSTCAYLIVQAEWPGSTLDTYRNFFLLSIGTAIGTWLSFSLRRVVLTFGDLAALEDDRLRPELRVAFMIALTFVIGLLFWTTAVQVAIGGFKSDFASDAPSALLIGALCGIAERAMATAVAKRADDFAAGVGGRTSVQP